MLSLLQECRNCDKKLASHRVRLRRHTKEVVNATDDDCLQQLTTPAAWRQSCSVDNSCGLMPCWTRGHIDIWTYFIWNQNISPESVLSPVRLYPPPGNILRKCFAPYFFHSVTRIKSNDKSHCSISTFDDAQFVSLLAKSM